MRNTLLRTARRNRGWTQRQLADFTELSVATIERAERGGPISGESMQRLCTCLHKTSEQLGLLHGMLEDQTFPVPNESQGHSLVSADIPIRPTRQDVLERVEAEQLPGVSPGSTLTFKPAKPPAPSLADVVQFSQIVLDEQAPDEHGMFLPSESGIVISPEPSVQVLSLTTARIDLPTWFGLQVNNLKAIGAAWQGSLVPYQQQQASIHAELERWNSMANQDDQRTSEYLITRRTALATLATLSTRLLTSVQGGPLSAMVVEEFLRESTTAITASWELLNGDGLATVEYSLPKYLLLLIKLAHQPSKYQQQAAYLASQGCLLMDLVSYHRFRFQEALAYARQSVEIAKISRDDNLLVYALVLLGGAFNLTGQVEMMLEKHQEAALHQKQVVLPLRSYVFAELAYAHAQNGQVAAALNRLSEAHTIFSDTFGDVPGFISADYNIFQLILFEGMTHLALAKCDTDNVLRHSTQAQTALAQFGKLPSTISVPERTKIEIINQQAAAAVGTGNMEEFISYLKAGAVGAKVLGSQKRKQEAIANWKAARSRWPYEKRVLELADVLME